MEDPLSAKIAEGIWVANTSCVTTSFMNQHEISAVISLDKGVHVLDDIFEYAVPNSELLDDELPKVIQKLNSICAQIKELRDEKRNIVIQCADGRNKSILVAGYYLIKRGGMSSTQVIEFLTGIYFTNAQVNEDKLDKARIECIQRGEDFAFLIITPEILERRAIRHNLRALTNQSFQKILRT